MDKNVLLLEKKYKIMGEGIIRQKPHSEPYGIFPSSSHTQFQTHQLAVHIQCSGQAGPMQ
jgi:hypothetical protein